MFSHSGSMCFPSVTVPEDYGVNSRHPTQRAYGWCTPDVPVPGQPKKKKYSLHTKEVREVNVTLVFTRMHRPTQILTSS